METLASCSAPREIRKILGRIRMGIAGGSGGVRDGISWMRGPTRDEVRIGKKSMGSRSTEKRMSFSLLGATNCFALLVPSSPLGSSIYPFLSSFFHVFNSSRGTHISRDSRWSCVSPHFSFFFPLYEFIILFKLQSRAYRQLDGSNGLVSCPPAKELFVDQESA